MQKVIIILSIFLGYLFSLFAQEGVSINEDGSSAEASAIFDVQSTSKGVLLPRVNLTSTSSSSPISGTPAVGLLVFNQATVNDVVPGFYFWTGAAWQGINATSSGGTPTYPSGSVFCESGPAAIVDVINPTTGKTWMDRNLGATQVATSSTDTNSYGDLYQWGRFSDGHQCRTSDTTATLSSGDQPGHGSFILTSGVPYDWRSTLNNNLWQGVNGTNNPCPSGYRLPTDTELENERLSWGSNDAAGAFASPLKLSVSGRRVYTTGGLVNVGTVGWYWGSTVHTGDSGYLRFSSTTAYMSNNGRSHGFTVRCIKD